MSVRIRARSTYVRTTWVTSMLLVAAVTQANVNVQSHTGAEKPHTDSGKDDADTQSSSGEAHATSAPTLWAVTVILKTSTRIAVAPDELRDLVPSIPSTSCRPRRRDPCRPG